MKVPTYVELDTLDTEQLRNLNRVIVGMLRDRAAMRQAEAGRAFKIGDIACFDLRGRIIRFRVERINMQSLSGPQVDLEGNLTGRKARAAPTLCFRPGIPVAEAIAAAEANRLKKLAEAEQQPAPAPQPAAPVRRRMRLSR